MNKPQTILLIDDHSLINTAMTALLEDMYDGVQVLVGTTAKEAFQLAEKRGDDADLMILDLGLPDSQGTDIIVKLLQGHPALKILVLSGITDSQSILNTLSSGAAGFVPKSLDADTLKTAINFVMEGGVYIPSKVLSQQQRAGMNPQLPEEKPDSKVHLTHRQCQVLNLLSQGDSIKSICHKMDLSEGTIKTHVAAIYRAFGAKNRTEALIAARKNGYIVN